MQKESEWDGEENEKETDREFEGMVLRMVRWCILLTHMPLICEVIRYRLVQIRQKSLKIFRCEQVCVVGNGTVLSQLAHHHTFTREPDLYHLELFFWNAHQFGNVSTLPQTTKQHGEILAAIHPMFCYVDNVLAKVACCEELSARLEFQEWRDGDSGRHEDQRPAKIVFKLKMSMSGQYWKISLEGDKAEKRKKKREN